MAGEETEIAVRLMVFVMSLAGGFLIGITLLLLGITYLGGFFPTRIPLWTGWSGVVLLGTAAVCHRVNR